MKSIDDNIKQFHEWNSENEYDCTNMNNLLKKQTKPRSAYNNGLNYTTHSDSTRVNVLY